MGYIYHNMIHYEKLLQMWNSRQFLIEDTQNKKGFELINIPSNIIQSKWQI